MKKGLLMKVIDQYLINCGCCKERGLCYSVLSADRSVKFIIKVPDMTRGFFIGVQLNDYGDFDGEIKHALLRYYQYESLLCFANIYDYTDEEICAATQKVYEDVATYLPAAREKLVEKLELWEINEDYEKEKIFSSIGFILPDPYSLEYLIEHAKEIAQSNAGRSTSFPYREYEEHKEFYDQYLMHGCKLVVVGKKERVIIMKK